MSSIINSGVLSYTLIKNTQGRRHGFVNGWDHNLWVSRQRERNFLRWRHQSRASTCLRADRLNC